LPRGRVPRRGILRLHAAALGPFAATLGPFAATLGLFVASWLQLACGSDALPVGMALVPVHRFVDGGLRPDPPLTERLPAATVRDDTRYVLRAPLSASIIFGKKLTDHRGNRLLVERHALPPSLANAGSVLAMPSVRVGPSWLEPAPQVLQVRREPSGSSVELQIPIPANPDGKTIQIAARGYAIDGPSLEHIDTGPVAVPDDAVLEFSVSVLEPAWGFDPVEFRVQACEADRCEQVFEDIFDPLECPDAGWRDHRVSLGELAGRKLRFRFEARRLAEEAPFSLPLWANPTLYAPAPRGTSARNVILLSVDTLRADHLSSYGYAHDTAPFMQERFGDGGAVFETLVAAATITTPSHATMFTSLYPVAHGTVDGLHKLPRNLPTLAEWIRGRGRNTAAITENGWLSISHGFGRGFDSFIENRSANIMDPDGQVDRTFSQARAWLKSNRDKRFFLFLHTFQVHTPYAPPARYSDLFASQDGTRIDADAPSHLRWQAEYDREIRYVDDELRLLFQTIDELGLEEDTVFILTSDHGEAFLEHGRLEHGARLDEEVVRVPLLFWGRGVPAALRVRVPAAHMDLTPTILELMDLPPLPASQGWSLVPLLDGDDGAPFLTRPVYSESRGALALGPDRSPRAFHPPAFLVRLGDRKLTRYRTKSGRYRYEYYDLATDPHELDDLFRTRPLEALDLHQLIQSYEERNRKLRASLDRENSPESQAAPLDPRQAEKLRALGYLR